MFARVLATAQRLRPAAAAAAVAVSTYVATPVHAAASMFDLSEADAMADDEQHHPRMKVYEYTKDFVEKDFEDAAMLWRHARAAYQAATVGKASPDKTLMSEALKTIKSAVQYDPNNGDARRWFGIILNAHSSFEGYSQQIADAFEVEAQWKQAIAINPDDASAHHLLGRWCWEVTEMPWYSRTLASTLFAEPPSSSYEDARDYFSNAERIQPGFWKMNQYMLAQCEQKLGQSEAAVAWLLQALALPVRSEEDRDVQGKALALLKRLDAARGAEAAKREDARLAIAAQLAAASGDEEDL